MFVLRQKINKNNQSILVMLFKSAPPQEKILILGLGVIGLYLAKRLINEGYAVTVIESDVELIQYADEVLDARLITGSAMSIACWREANAEGMDFLIAVTDNDAVNMLASMIGDRFGIESITARVRSLEFGLKDSFLKGEDLKIDLFIHPEEIAAQEIVRLVKSTAGNEIIDVALGQMQVMAAKIDKKSSLANKNLIQISKKYNKFPFRVVAIARGITTIIPGGKDKILPDDHILIMAATEHLPKLMKFTSVKQENRHRILILGGGLVGARIATLLGKTVKVTMLEKDEKHAMALAAKLEDTEVLHGDGSDKDVLELAGLQDIDTFIAATGSDETNIMSCILVKHLVGQQKSNTANKRLKVISLVDKEEYVVLATTSGSDIALNKKILAGNEILTYIRRSELLSMTHIHGFGTEVVDLIAGAGSPITIRPLVKLAKSLSREIIIGSVFRDGKWETAVGETHIEAGERVLAICTSDSIKKLRELFL
jgi:trk system potassium uptake protein TrkA